MGFFKKAIDWMLSREPQKKSVSVVLSPESVKSHHLIKSLSYENAELKGRLAKLEIEQGKSRQREEDILEEKEVVKSLNKQEKELKPKVEGLSMRGLFFELAEPKNKQLRDKLSFYTFNRGKKIAKFGDIIFTTDGKICLVDNKRNPILKTFNLKDMFQSVSGLVGDIKGGKIPLNLDEEGDYIENIMEYELPEIVESGDKLKYAKARKAPVYKIMAGLNQQISDTQFDLEESENLNTSLQNKIDKLESEKKIAQTEAQTSRAESTSKEDRYIEINKQFEELKKENLQLEKKGELLEDGMMKLEKELSKMRKQAERENVKLSDAKALETFGKIADKLESIDKTKKEEMDDDKK